MVRLARGVSIRVACVGALLLLTLARPASAQSPPTTAPSSDPMGTRLALMPTARTLPRGGVSLTMLDILFPIVQVGLTDRASMGVGTILVPSERPPIFLLPKVQVYRSARTQGAAGVLHVTGDFDYSGGFAFGVVTHTTGTGAVTLGSGWVYARGGGESARVPVLIAGVERQLTPRRKFIADALVVRDFAIVNTGVRVIGGRFVADYWAGVLVGDGTLLPTFGLAFAWRLN